MQSKKGYANIDNAKIYYEAAGGGTPFVMIHAGVADSRQWNNEFAHFANDHQVVRYDMRGYGKSEPVEGEYKPIGDLISLLDHLGIQEPMVLMGCSMGGGLALDFALEHPARVKALTMVASGPSGLDLDTAEPEKFAQAVKAFEAGDLDLTAELETQIWFDGIGRTPDQVDPAMRALLYDMDRLALSHEVKELGKRLHNSETPAFDRLGELNLPVLIITGEHDIEYMHAAAEYMEEHIREAQTVVMEDAAHLPNMDHPQRFQAIVREFLNAQPA